MTLVRPPPLPDPTRVLVLNGFRLFEGNAQVPLAEGSERLLALLALRGRAVKRVLVAGTLWPEASESRAFACLRSSLARLHRIDQSVIAANPVDVRLAATVHVDLDEARALAHRLLDIDRSPDPEDTGPAAIALLSGELLPDWYDDWVLLESEDWRQLRLHALEALAGWLTANARYGDAAVAALAAIGVDPLRESARATLIRVHVAEHNQSEALREFTRYQRLLRAELDLEPTPQLSALIPGREPVTPR